MKAHLGQAGVWLALIAAALGCLLLVIDQVRQRQGKAPSTMLDGRLLIPLAVLGALMATVAMQWALITHDFSIAYVAENNARVTPLIYSITGMWSALAGSILLWGLVLSFLIVAVVWRYRRLRDDSVVSWAVAVMLFVMAFFFALMAGPANPFVTTGSTVPTSGAGPNALLQNNPLVAIHPPLLYVGLVGFTVPFAFAIAMLITGRVDESWQLDTRRWALFAWTSLTVGIVLGAWWSYQVLGWGGFWGWDPVENAALMPWLVGTAFVHSIVVEERRGLLRVWNLCLAISVFALTILGTFLTRSGVVQSVHAFSASSLGTILICFFAFIVLGGLALIYWRGDQLRSSVGLDAAFSREGAFVLNNLLFVAFAVVVLAGTVFPLLYEAINGGQVTVGTPYFNAIAIPLGIGLLTLMAVAPVLSWRHASFRVMARRLEIPVFTAAIVLVVLVASGVRGFAPLVAFFLGTVAATSALRTLALDTRAERRRGGSGARALLGRSGGGMIVHLGVVILAMGIVASTSYVTRGQIILPVGKVVHFDGHSFEYLGIENVATPVKTQTLARIRVDGGSIFRPGTTQFTGRASEGVGTPAIDSSFTGDVYMILTAATENGSVSAATIKGLTGNTVVITVDVEPLLPWLWAGGLVIGIGGLLTIVPDRRRRRGTASQIDPDDIDAIEPEPTAQAVSV